MNVSSWALTWFVIVAIFMQAALGVDCLLILLGYKSITWRCVEKYHWVAVLLVAIVGSAAVALALHFIFYVAS